MVLGVGLGLRLVGVSDSPLTFHPTRQYLGLRVAKAQYVKGRTDVPPWERAAAVANGRDAPRLEPRLLETAVVAGYRLLGRERTWMGGVLSSVLWTVGGVCLFLLARRLASNVAAGVALAFYLFLPFGVGASRSFQPDPAMVAFMLAGLLAMVRFRHDPTPARLAAAGVPCGVAILVKPVCVFVLVAAFFATGIGPRGLRKGLLDPAALVFLALAVVPAGAFYLHGIASGGELESSAESSFIARLLTDGAYWTGWYRMVDLTVGVVFALVALLSIVVARSREARFLVGGLWLGYLAYGLVFNYHIHTHDYYQLQLIPIVALGLGLTVDAAMARLPPLHLSAVLKGALGVAAAVVAASILQADLMVARPPNAESAAAQVSEWERIGALVSHSTNTVMLAPTYGWTLGYHGNLAGASWPSVARGDFRLLGLRGGERPTTAELFEQFTRSRPDWFIITALAELDRQPDLRALLDERARLAAHDDGYLIYDLRPAG